MQASEDCLKKVIPSKRDTLREKFWLENFADDEDDMNETMIQSARLAYEDFDENIFVYK